ncbi:exodeoxyribonuclease V subunit gamma [Shewanella gelidii]|uniref:RecBCD enzyme subunit RecC n=1 Tax=Shewanella gelidii TaxID=1642821 RepID=A0A917JZY2_9GAMM|nr:exodeoxyribonuclease V subunit gamma [Shewanella gelidii]MCL1098165.1 exodeoxyribonuclease V subunit gamma [Shewanella gelidii]GGI91085.1 RecBCD enzyme subunit RecC [Shewanella gelidii]
MLYLIQSNQMESLSEQLAAELAKPAADMPIFMNEQVLVQSPGMATWLRLEIAQYNKIAAGIEFPLPSSFIWQLCHDLLPNVPKENAFTKPLMTWKLMQLLPSLLTQAEFEPLKQYLDDEAPLKLFQLCGKIADVYDQYLVYRPDWILAWESHEEPFPLSSQQAWQPILWRALIDFNANPLNDAKYQPSAQADTNRHYHRTNLHQSLFDALANPDTDISMLPQRLFVFGISSMAPQTLEVLHGLAQRIDVMILSLSPCMHYWGDIVDSKLRAKLALSYQGKKQLAEAWESKLEVGNPILASNGKMGRELLDLMLSLPEDNINLSHDQFVEVTPHNLLTHLQNDILQLQTRGESLGPDGKLYQSTDGKHQLAHDDDSITLRSCHSPLREIETLHDHLLAQFSRDPSLLAKDIVVMLPDVAKYAPYIDAVFAAKEGAHYIPYAIADRGAAQESPLINSFLHLLSLDQSRFALSEILGLLEVPAILRRFELDDDELQLIRAWLERAGVRWGRDGQNRQELDLPAFTENSWATGIRRMLLGYALTDGSSLYDHYLPVSGIEGHASQALGKLLNFIEALDEHKLSLAQEIPVAERLEALEQLTESFYDVDDQEREQLQEIRDALAKLKDELEQAGLDAHLNIQVIQQWFVSRLTESRVGQHYLAGSVNFCTLMPMRSIPFKLVCLLGMNDGEYPRTQHPVGFDLIAHQGPRKGDRSRRLDDRYLFLEALLSARQQLYLSYIGHSERDNAERIPSMLVSELVEFCQLSFIPQALCEQAKQISTDNDNKQQACCEEKSSTMNSGDSEKDNPNSVEVHNQISAMQSLLALSDQCIAEQMIQTQPLQPFDKRLFTRAETDTQLSVQLSYEAQWCPEQTSSAHQSLKAGPRTKFILADEIRALTSANNGEEANNTGVETRPEIAQPAANQDFELASLIRFYRNPAQYFFNRCLSIDLSLDIQVDDNDEPFTIEPLQRYKVQSRLLDEAIRNGQLKPEASVIEQLKASGSLPIKPFDDLILGQYLKDISPLIDRTLYLIGETTREVEVEVTLTSNNQLPVTLTGRIDQVCAKGMVSYRPGRANGRDLVRQYLRHLALNAMGLEKTSYLNDIHNFHAFKPLTSTHALNQLQTWFNGYQQGLITPLHFAPKTSLAYAEAEGDHLQRLVQIKEVWIDEQNELGEGMEPHNRRLYQFPHDFTEIGFGTLAKQLLEPLLSAYETGKLAELQSYVEGVK